MSENNFFVSQTGEIVAVCPQCKNSKLISVAAYKGKKFTVKVKCPCMHIFALNLDFRRHYRKCTLLEGNYRKPNLNIESFYEKLPVNKGIGLKHTERGMVRNCTVKDISMSGIGLDIWGSHTIEEGDRLLVEFHLDNKRNPLIKCEVIVKTVLKNFVGVEFKDKVTSNADLRFYLLS